MPHRSQPEHLSDATTCGAWYPFELNAGESASTLVGQNSTQNPHPLHRSTMIATEPFANGPSWGVTWHASCQSEFRGFIAGIEYVFGRVRVSDDEPGRRLRGSC